MRLTFHSFFPFPSLDEVSRLTFSLFGIGDILLFAVRAASLFCRGAVPPKNLNFFFLQGKGFMLFRLILAWALSP